jgi:DNA-binding response OmpR family regulator
VVNGEIRHMPPIIWRFFTVLHRAQRRGDVVPAEMLESRQGSESFVREAIRRLRRVLDGSDFEIRTWRSIGYDLIDKSQSARRKAA